MKNQNRDDFSQSVKDTLAKRAGYRCSNPNCQKTTIGAQEGDSKSISIGIAAHIAAAAPNGPRYDSSMTAQERSSIDNGIWLCSNCSILIDKDENCYTVDVLKSWKANAEKLSHTYIAQPSIIPSNNSSTNVYCLLLLKEDLTTCLQWLSLFQKAPHSILDSNNFPLPSDWEELLANNSSFLGLEFTVKLHSICQYIDKLKILMDGENKRIKKLYPHKQNSRIADMGSVIYCRELDKITEFLLNSFTQTVLNTFSQKLKY